MIVALWLLGWILLNAAWYLVAWTFCLISNRHMYVGVVFVGYGARLKVPLCWIALPGERRR
jgi:hypothetical protein